MRKSLALLSLLLWSISSVAQDVIPSWLQAKIEQYQKLPPAQPLRTVLLVRYQDKVAYYVPPICCDIPSELYDASGSLICYPGGGFAGGDGKCPRFRLAEAQPTTVWRDSRTPPR